jgi:hypothetical protein
MGFGMGQAMANQMANAMNRPPAGQQPAPPPQGAAPSGDAPSGDAPMTRERIIATIDNLDEQLAAGKISEETYNRLHAKWQKRLDEMG